MLKPCPGQAAAEGGTGEGKSPMERLTTIGGAEEGERDPLPPTTTTLHMVDNMVYIPQPLPTTVVTAKG